MSPHDIEKMIQAIDIISEVTGFGPEAIIAALLGGIISVEEAYKILEAGDDLP